MRINARVLAIFSASLCTGLSGCGTAKVAHQQAIGAAPAGEPTIIYVADFELDASSIKSEPGMAPPPPKAPGPLGSILPAPPGALKDPQILAQDLVDSMSTLLVNNLTDAGLTARRLTPRDPMPQSGWLVRGVFTEVNQGNQLQRTVVGFGMGKTDLQVVVDVNDLGQGTPRRFYEVQTTADSGKAPGAAPMIVINPAGATARFVIAGKDLGKNVKQTASRIAAEVAQRAKQATVGPGKQA